jgi:hypothetical protein
MSGLVYLTIKLSETRVVFAWAVIIAVLVFSIASFAVGIVIQRRYREVYDYETAALLGREFSGKSIRRLISVFIYFGVWACIAGVFLLIWLESGVALN